MPLKLCLEKVLSENEGFAREHKGSFASFLRKLFCFVGFFCIPQIY